MSGPGLGPRPAASESFPDTPARVAPHAGAPAPSGAPALPPPPRRPGTSPLARLPVSRPPARRLVQRETLLVPWRDILRVYRRLEARGEIRGGIRRRSVA